MIFERVNVREDRLEVSRWLDMERSLVQILVTVAITQIKILRIEVEKGFRWTSIEPELVEPNMSINFVKIEQMDGLLSVDVAGVTPVSPVGV